MRRFWTRVWCPGPLGAEAVKSLGVEEFVELLASPPPGVDELVALADVIAYAKDDSYDRVIVDTAPTGHALRLLDLPQFADGFVERLVRLRDRVGSLATLAGGALGVGQVAEDVDAVASKLEGLRDSLELVRSALRDSTRTEFLAVGIPTELAYAETSRLARSLKGEAKGGGVSLRSLVVNRCLDPLTFGGEQAGRLAARQRAVIDDFCGRRPLSACRVTEVALENAGSELKGVFGLRFLGKKAFEATDWDDVFAPSPRSTRLLVCGGKGGVGKTTTSAAIAVRCADEGLATCVVSTDPAHSLGDALDADLSRGAVVPVDTFLGGGGRLDALEVDGDAASLEAAKLLKEGLGEQMRRFGDQGGGALADLADALETAPPGLDELVSLLKVLELVRSKTYDVIVLDTAPTGHTLRLLALPELLDDFAERSMAARDRLKRNPLVAAALGSALGDDAAVAGARDRIQELQDKAFAMDAVLKNPQTCEFLMVAAPTDLSLTETANLKTALDDADLKADRLVVNAVLQDTPEALAAFANSAKDTQRDALDKFHTLAADLGLDVVTAPQFDADLRGTPGLEALAAALFK